MSPRVCAACGAKSIGYFWSGDCFFPEAFADWQLSRLNCGTAATSCSLWSFPAAGTSPVSGRSYRPSSRKLLPPLLMATITLPRCPEATKLYAAFIQWIDVSHMNFMRPGAHQQAERSLSWVISFPYLRVLSFSFCCFSTFRPASACDARSHRRWRDFRSASRLSRLGLAAA